MAPSAKGVEILKGSKPKWRIGKKLGSGACATVHVLETIEGVETEYAIKVAPVPKKTTRKGNSEEETNVRLLYFEHLVYANIVPDIRGTYVPKMPVSSKGPPSSGEAGGFKFMVLERMDCELSEIVPILLQQSKGGTVNFGPIAVQLLECTRAIQERKQVVIDTKPDNYMLNREAGTGSTPVHKLASRIRLLDLALVKPWKSIESHRENEGTNGVAGTPLYASINVHKGETPSRRDDFESVGYVIAELIMKLVAGDTSVQLPWHNGNSDEHIGEMKEECMDDTKSIFFQQLGNKAVIKVMSEYFEEVRGYAFKKTPDYDKLISILSKLKIPTPAHSWPSKNRASAAKKPLRAANTTTTTTTKRRTRAQKRGNPLSDDEEDSQNPSPSKVARESVDTEMEEIVIDCSERWADAQPMPHPETPHDDDDSFATATMDWEATVDENEEPVVSKPASKPSTVGGVTVLVEAGPHKGHSFNMIKGQNDTYIIGKSPSPTAGETALALANDDETDDAHIRMELQLTKKLTSVRVVDLKSSSGTFVGSERVRKGKDYRLFQGQSVTIGQTTLTIRKLDPSASSTLRESLSSTGTATTSTRSTRSSRAAARSTRSTPECSEVIELIPSSDSKPKAARGIQLVVIEGPHKGEHFALTKGGDETFIIGSNPKSAVGTIIRLDKDTSLKTTHARIDLNVARKLITVDVVDKSKGGTMVNSSTVNKGRAFINDRIAIGSSVLEVQPLQTA